MNRRGFGLEGALVTVVLIGVTVIALAVIFKTILTSAEDEFTEKECQTSLLLTRNIEELTTISCIQPTGHLALKCSRNFLSVAGNEVKRNGRSVSNEYDSSCPEEYGLGEKCMSENVIADEMAKCWRLFFEGEVPVFQQMEVNALKLFTDKNSARVCFICSEVTLKNREDNIYNLEEYMAAMDFDEGRSYYDFIAGNPDAYCDNDLVEAHGDCWKGIAQGREPKWIDRFLNPWGTISTEGLEGEKTYAVTFVRRGMSSCEEMKKIDKYVSGTMGAWVKNAFKGGASYANYKMIEGEKIDSKVFDFYLTHTVQAMEADKISSYCDTVIA